MDYIDTHFHVWELEKFKYDWPTPDMTALYKNFYPCGLEAAVEGTPVKHAVFVQCLNGSPEEAKWVIDMASRHPIIKGVVAGLDLTSPKLEEIIVSLQQTGLLKGVRHILDVEKDDWITRDDVNKGFDVLSKYNMTYDLLVRPNHLKHVPKVVSAHPSMKFIVNHIAKPPVREGKLDGWKEDMSAIAAFPNVYCKISGLISELTPDVWKQVNFQPFIDHVLDVFTADRCIFGSDWPVFSQADATYFENFNNIKSLLSKLDEASQIKIFRENAIKVYGIITE